MNLKIKNFWMLLALLVSASVFTGCDNDDPEPVNEEELITTVRVTFTNQANAGDVVVATFTDIDGEGGDDPITVNPTLSANATYTVGVEFLNESETPAEDITEEVEEEGDEHQVFMVVSGGLNLTYEYGDTDGNGNPLGLTGTAATGAASTGTLNVVLRHEPKKPNTGLADAGGETDITVDFAVTIQ